MKNIKNKLLLIAKPTAFEEHPAGDLDWFPKGQIAEGEEIFAAGAKIFCFREDSWLSIVVE